MNYHEKYQSLTIFETLQRINSGRDNALYLPALQRLFVWHHERICALFDSLMRDYPIGTFLFWEVSKTQQGDCSFYEFIKEYSGFEGKRLNLLAGPYLPSEITGVLDGQQRLNSMYVALQGSYAYYAGGKGRSRGSLANFRKRLFYLNVLWEADEEDNQKYEFQFLTEDEAAPVRFSDNQLWFPVGEVFHCESSGSLKENWRKFRRTFPPRFFISDQMEERALNTLNLLRRKIREEKLITYYSVRGCSLTEALDIFVRMNHGGIPLSLKDLIFSTIATKWNDGRKKIEDLNRELNSVGHHFYFDTQSLMLASLVLSGNPVRVKIESFKPANVDSIIGQWSHISKALLTAVGLVVEWGFSGNNKVSNNAIIAIALMARHTVDIAKSNEQLRLFFIRSLICGLFDRRPERMLTAVRDYLQQVPPGSSFQISDFIKKAKLPLGLSLEVTAKTLDELIMTQIWHTRVYLLLSLLHGRHDHHEYAFEKDHIHPNSKFADLSSLKISAEREAHWRDWKDRLPNLQLLQEVVNNDKRASAFKDWLHRYHPESKARIRYLEQNNIPEDCSLDFTEFESFFIERKILLRKRLAILLEVTDDSSVTNVSFEAS